MVLRKDVIKLPRLNSEEDGDEERHANWTELLFDLVFVAAISLLTLNLSRDYSFLGLVESLPLFFVIWWGWVGHTFYMSRFGTDDLLNRFLTMLQMLIVASLAVNVRDALGSTGTGFALSYAALRSILVLEYYLVGRQAPQVQTLTNHYALGFGIAAALWAVSAFIPAPWRFAIWGVALVIDLLTPLTASEKHLKFPPHSTHLPERFGLFTIIVIGEAIVSVVFTISNIGITIATEIAGLMGLIIAFTIWWAYFEEARGAEARVLEAGTQIRKYQLWLYSHFPLLIGIAMVAAGIKHVLSLSLWQPMDPGEVWVLCSGLALALLSLSAIFFSAYRLDECKNREIHRFRLPYYVIIVLVLLTGFLGPFVPGEVILGILTILCLVKVALSFRKVTYQTCDIK
ncbi:MAG: low temperature requirement protein A [Methanobacteriaceae archaeon]|nr:low temperature requirement protein A [Methanobacteriaceae archaeon]